MIVVAGVVAARPKAVADVVAANPATISKVTAADPDAVARVTAAAPQAVAKVAAANPSAVAKVAVRKPGALAKVAAGSVKAGTGSSEPWDGYDEQTVAQVRKGLAEADESEIRTVLSYEAANKNRKGVLTAAEAALDG